MSNPLPFVFLSSVQGHLVSRHPTVRGQRPTYIGATRNPADPTEVTWHEDRVVAIPQSEFHRYRREYERELKAGTLRKRTEKDWTAQEHALAVEAKKQAAAAAQPEQAKTPTEKE